jgi:hypothetical protein
LERVIGRAVADEPTAVVPGKLSGLGASVASGADDAAPVPVSAAVWVEPAVALSVTVRVAESGPTAVGVKPIVIKHVAEAANVLPHEVVENEEAFAPVMAMLVMVRVVLPVFESEITFVGAEEPTFVDANVTGPLRVACGVAAIPVPVRTTDCGDPAALSEISTEASDSLGKPGEKVTETVQKAPVARVGPQLLDMVKSPGVAPPRAIPVKLIVAVPVLVMVKVCGVLLEPMLVLG